MAKTPPRGKSPAKKQPSRAAAPRPRKVPVKAPPAPVPGVPESRRRIAVEVEPPAPPPAPKALPAGEPVDKEVAFPFEIDPKRIEEGLKKLQTEVAHWANKGRYTKVRFKFRGKQLLPDLPFAAVAAAEGLTFYWGGVLRLLIANVVGSSVLQVELINDADKRVQAGKEALLSGDVDQALALFREALAMDRNHAAAHLHVGVALKLQGDREGARAAFEKARKNDPEGPTGAEAERLAAGLRPPGAA
jgi:tetratricopeptide (TPR) repeat protein